MADLEGLGFGAVPPGEYSVKVKDAEFLYAEAYPFPPVPTHVAMTYTIPALGQELEVLYDIIGAPQDMIERVLRGPS